MKCWERGEKAIVGASPEYSKALLYQGRIHKGRISPYLFKGSLRSGNKGRYSA